MRQQIYCVMKRHFNDKIYYLIIWNDKVYVFILFYFFQMK